jgi:hypothetical protein
MKMAKQTKTKGRGRKAGRGKQYSSPFPGISRVKSPIVNINNLTGEVTESPKRNFNEMVGKK